MQDHTRLMLDRVGIRLEMLDMLGKPAILLLQLKNLFLQLAALDALLLIRSEAVGPEHHVVSEEARKGDSQHRRHAAA